MIGKVIIEFIGTLFIEFLWNTIFNFLGGSIRWIYGTIWQSIANKSRFRFKEYINGPENSNDWFDEKGHHLVNSLVGLIAFVCIITFLIYLI